MKVVILCGGSGIIIDEKKGYIPKALTPVDNKPLIYLIIKHFSFYGCKDFILCVDSRADEIKRCLDSLPEQDKRWLSKLNISYEQTGDESRTGARIFLVKDKIGHEEFILSYSDTLADINISQLLQFHKAKGKILTMTGVHPTTRHGMIKHSDGLVTDFSVEEKSQSTVKGGFFVCKPEIFDYLSADPYCTLEREPLTKLIAKKEVALYDHDGFWKNFDSIKDIYELNNLTKGDYPSWRIQ